MTLERYLHFCNNPVGEEAKKKVPGMEKQKYFIFYFIITLCIDICVIERMAGMLPGPWSW